MKKAELVRATLRRFPHVPKKTLAKYLITQYPTLFVNKDGQTDVENARDSIRYYTKAKGMPHAKSLSDENYCPHEAKFPPSIMPKRTPYIMKPGLWLVMADAHVPFHDVKALECVIEYGQTQKVNGLFLNGDIQDCEAVGFWPVIGKRDFNLEVELTIDFLDFLRNEFKGKPIIWKPGNHEDRLKRYYTNNAPQLANLPEAEMEMILSLESRNIEFLGYKQKVLFGKLPVLHGHELRGGNANLVNPARWLFLKAKTIAMCSHFHRVSKHEERTLNKKDIVTWTTGCLCSLEPDYNPEANNWTHGFSLINLESNGEFEVENRRILENGKII